MKRLIGIFLLSLLFLDLRGQSADLQVLAKWMQGSFDSREQHLQDTSNYFDINLEIIPVWTDRVNGFWFYVEQAVSGNLEKPYRQRIYQLTENEKGVFESKIFLLKDPLRFAGRADLIEKLNPDSITEKEGCSVFLKRTDQNTFLGSTLGKNCPSERNGSSYATAEVKITATTLESWDRGFDENDKQVWGAESGAYIFRKK
ncbi:MAG TPA: chromophore lyase CpcT/CpeT [Bacteroidia bacterium]|nr:chromophore lyase CpcT/CpeT [Bacteroidia bacterium]HNS13046.1 chromophore lyase CpcT/CpeT [Bacteroidia bacterium]